MPLDKHWFVKLHDALLAKFKEECLRTGETYPSNSNQLYGYGNYNERLPSLVDALNEHPAVKSHLENLNAGKKSNEQGFKSINGKYLYNKMQEVEDEKTKEIKLNDFYETIYLKYLGYKDLEAFQDANARAIAWTHYECFYYSFKNHAVQSFGMKLSFEADEIRARIKGFHDETEEQLEGTAEHKNGRLHIRAFNASGYEIFLVATLGNERPQQLQYMYCAFLTVSSAGFPVSHRGMLLKTNDQPLNEESMLRVKRYMMLKRQSIRAPFRTLYALEDLKVNSNNSVDRIAHLVGTYRVWRYDDEGNIVQSKLTIADDYTTTLYSDLFTKEFNEQICLLDISTEYNHRLCISTHPSNTSTQIIYYAMVEIPHKRRVKYLNGVFCSVGAGREKSIGRDMVLYNDKSEFKPTLIEKEEIKGFVDGKPDLQILRSRLNDIEIENLRELLQLQLPGFPPFPPDTEE